MTDFKQHVTEYLNGSRAYCEEMMYEGGYTSNWTKDSNEPFEHKGVDFYGGEGEGDDFWTVI